MTRRYRFYDNTTENANISSVLDVSSRRVLRNTYFLLSICLAFSAITTAATIALQLPYPGFLITIVGYFGLLFLVTKNRNSGLGILFVLALTGFMGYTLGPIVGLLAPAQWRPDCYDGPGWHGSYFPCHVRDRTFFQT